MLGLHWMARLEGATGLDDEARATRLLRTLPSRLGLRAVGPPQVLWEPGRLVAGVQLLAESHTSVHLLPAEGSGFVDVFSCRAFDVAVAAEVVRELYAPRRMVEEVVRRGQGETA